MTVFAVQMQMELDEQTRELRPRFPSISKATVFGEIEYILSSSANPFVPDMVLGDIHEKLSGFSDDDYLLLIGNPVLIGMCSSIAAYYNEGRVKFLQWSGKHHKYIMIASRLY